MWPQDWKQETHTSILPHSEHLSSRCNTLTIDTNTAHIPKFRLVSGALGKINRIHKQSTASVLKPPTYVCLQCHGREKHDVFTVQQKVMSY